MKQLTLHGMLQNTFKQAFKHEPQLSASGTCASATLTFSSYIIDDKP